MWTGNDSDDPRLKFYMSDRETQFGQNLDSIQARHFAQQWSQTMTAAWSGLISFICNVSGRLPASTPDSACSMNLTICTFVNVTDIALAFSGRTVSLAI
jgi:hypothetical protein